MTMELLLKLQLQAWPSSLRAWYVSADKIQIHADCWPTSLQFYPILTEQPDLCYLLGYLFHRHLEWSRWVPLDWHTKALLPRDSTFARGLVIERKCDHDGILIWRAKVYPIFDPREFKIEFEDSIWSDFDHEYLLGLTLLRVSILIPTCLYPDSGIVAEQSSADPCSWLRHMTNL